MKKSTNPEQNCLPPAFSQMRRFSYGDSVEVTQPDAGLKMGHIYPILGFSRNREGTNIIIEGPMPKELREACLQPDTTKEELFRILPKRIAEIPVTTAEEYLKFIPAGSSAIMNVSYRAELAADGYPALKMAA